MNTQTRPTASPHYDQALWEGNRSGSVLLLR